MAERFSRRRFMQFASLSAVGMALAACAVPAAAPAAQEGAEGAAPSADKVAVRFNCRVGTQGDYFTQQAEAFNAENPGIEVTVEVFPGEEYYQKMSTMIVGGTIGDSIWTASIGNFYNYAAAGTYAPVDDFIAADSYDLSVFYPAGVEAAKYDGKMFSLPWIVHPGRVGVFYNINAFEEAGLDVPTADWTYETFAETASALTKADGGQTSQWGWAPELSYFGMLVPIRSYGGDWLNPEGTTCTVAEEPAVAGLKEWEKFYQELQIAPSPAQADANEQMWASGRVAMVQAGYWGQAWGRELVKDFEWMVAPAPKGSAGSQSMFEWDGNVILSQSKAQREAWEFLKFNSTKDAGIKIAQMGSVPGGRPDVWEDPSLMEFPPHAVFAEIMKTIQPLVLPNNFRYNELFQIADNELDPVWLGEATIDDVIEGVRASMQDVLDMPRA